MVLRQCDNEQYKLVGDCDIDGSMDGQFIESGRPVREFDLAQLLDEEHRAGQPVGTINITQEAQVFYRCVSQVNTNFLERNSK